MLLLGEPAEHDRHLARVVAGGVHDLEPEVVGLRFLAPAVVEKPEHVAELRALPRDGRDRHRDDRDGGDQRELGQVLRGQHLGRVTGGDVPHLVPDDRGELVLVVAQLDERRVDVDRAAGEREGVHLGRIDDVEGVREELEGRLGRGRLEALADRVDELGERREAEQRHLGLDLLLELLAQADVAVDRVEVRVVGMHPGAADD